MKSWLSKLRLAACLAIAIFYNSATAQNPPSDFASVTVSTQWNEVVGLTFTEDGQDMFVWERGGRVWVVRNNQRQLLLNISEEVGGWYDHGLLGFALHPHFEENGYIYLLYLVDRHHLKKFGTAAYSPTMDEYLDATIGRVTRYTVSKNGTGYMIVPGSRKILLGETITNGIAVLTISHSTGSLVFGTDHTLLVSTGDGASPDGEDTGNFSTTYHAKALEDGIIRPAENVGAFRAQMVDCYNGKILRIDAETGQGIPSNPFYDPARPNSAKSKVWALGLRNPFRMSLKPGTGSHSPAEGNPGVLYVGDVGWNQWEEINIVDRPGENFGWPIYEGHNAGDGSLYPTILRENRDAHNPLYQVNGCNREYFYFQELIKQETPTGTAIFTNPCNGTQNIPASTPTFVHSRPLLAWNHNAQLPRVATFSGQTATTASVSPGASPVPGPSFSGRSSTGGLFYAGADFMGYQNSYFFGDYATGWIRNITVDGNDKPTSVRNFVNENAIVVAFAAHPSEPGLYYVNFPSEIRKIYFSSNRPPVAMATADKIFGTAPLPVQFKGDASTDPENQQLAYEWNFGDGSPVSNIANPAHTFDAPAGVPTMRIVTLKVTDNQGASSQTTINISINNTPPEVTITNPLDNSVYSINAETQYTLRADVRDAEFANSQLSYKWQTVLHHDPHVHPSPPATAVEPVVELSPLGCDGQTYFYRISLIVTDPAGASTTKEVRVYPDCAGVKVTPVISWPDPAAITVGTALSAAQLNATATFNGNAVAGTFTYTPPLGTVLGVGNGQQLLVNFAPSDASVYNAVSKAVLINVLGNFYRAINLNGPALVIDGRNWEASASAAGFSFTNGIAFSNQNVILNPSTDVNRATMIRSSIYGNNVGIAMANVPAGTYQVYLYVWEDNNAETFSVSVEGAVVRSNFNSGTTGSWTKLGPYQANITDGIINVNANGGAANLSGLEVWTVSAQATPSPTVVNPIADQAATVGVTYAFSFASNTFSGSGLSYTATLSNGNALPAWLTFNPTARTFSGTPASSNTGTIEIRVTAANTDGSAHDLFNLAVNEGGTFTFYRAINLNGPALSIDGNSWQASASAPGFSFTNGTAFSSQNVTLIPSTDANRATMIRSSIYGNAVGIAMANVPAGIYQVYL